MVNVHAANLTGIYLKPVPEPFTPALLGPALAMLHLRNEAQAIVGKDVAA
jgi:hypothetical protein